MLINMPVERTYFIFISGWAGIIGSHIKKKKKKKELMSHPWFLDRVDDYYDSTYCDFYAKINILKDEGENNVSTNN